MRFQQDFKEAVHNFNAVADPLVIRIKSIIDIVFNAHLLVFAGDLPLVVGCGRGIYITWDQAGTKIKECHEFQVNLQTEELYYLVCSFVVNCTWIVVTSMIL